ncbi:MAG: prepilin-type N-terminal cleavage/methylation domain-containing protein [Pseudomonadota bacterium]
MSGPRPRRGRLLGFTLVELLVAISVLAIVAVLGWRGLDGIIRSRHALTAQLEQTRGLQLAFAQMQSDCEHMASAALLHQRQNLKSESGALLMVRTVFAENEPARLQVVTYRLRDGLLTRRESLSTRDLVQLDAMWKTAMDDTDQSGAGVQLQAGVAGFTVRLWEGAEWRDAGAAAVALLPTVPSGLEVGLQLQGQETKLIKTFLLGAL